jgi:hypothetical protein
VLNSSSVLAAESAVAGRVLFAPGSAEELARPPDPGRVLRVLAARGVSGGDSGRRARCGVLGNVSPGQRGVGPS